MRITQWIILLGTFAIVHTSPVALAQNETDTQPASGASQAGAEVQSIQTILARMSRVSHTLNYQGSFTYEHQHSYTLQSFRVSHWVEDGIEYERLQYLSGPEREIVRNGQALDCYPPGDQLLQGRLTQMGQRLAGLEEFYQFQVRSVERVAGRMTTVLQVIPRDVYRYGLVLSVDQETGLILKSLTVDTNGRSIERYQFVELDLNPDVEAMKNSPLAQKQRVAKAPMNECNQTRTGEPQEWRVRWIPPGFAFTGQQKVSPVRDMLMYTDGLTTFSIFIEAAGSPPPEGVGQRGPTVLYMSKAVRNDQLYRVTVVGEIPAVAAEQIAASIEASTAVEPVEQ